MEESRKIIALTGGIGSGKSTVLNYIKELGYPVLSSDAIVSDLYKTAKVKRMLKKAFPTAVKGVIFLKIDRKELSRIVFNDGEKHALLTSMITPLVHSEIFSRAKKLNGLVFVEVPLLFECDYQNDFDQVIVVVREKSARIESVKQRSNLSEQEIIERMNKQVDYDKKDLSHFFVIANDGDEQCLKEKVNTVISQLEE